MFPRNALDKAAKVGTEIASRYPVYGDIVWDRFDRAAAKA